jgi:hypothetical protein
MMAMMPSARTDQLNCRTAPLEMTEDEFRSLGHDLVDRIASFLASIRERAVRPAQAPEEVRTALKAKRTLPESGTSASVLLNCAADLLFDHSLFTGHPRFFGYITSSAAPIGDARGVAGGCNQRKCRRLEAISHGHRNGSSDNPVARGIHWLRPRLWRFACQWRQHGEFHMLLSRSRGKGRLGCS